jgi:hypothetical protein
MSILAKTADIHSPSSNYDRQNTGLFAIIVSGLLQYYQPFRHEEGSKYTNSKKPSYAELYKGEKPQ